MEKINEFRILLIEESSIYKRLKIEQSWRYEKKLEVILKKGVQVLTRVLEDRLLESSTRRLFQFFLSHRSQSNDNETIVYEDLSRENRCQILANYFFNLDVDIDKRAFERGIVSQSTLELENLYVTFKFSDDKTFVFPRHLFVIILSYCHYDSKLLFRVGRTCQTFYLLILSTWPSVRITSKNIYKISSLVLQNVRRISFSRKAVKISKRELEYLWGSITPKSIQEIDMKTCFSGAKKFLKSIEEYQQQEDTPSTLFDNCQSLVLPNCRKYDPWNGPAPTLPLYVFPNISTIHISIIHLIQLDFTSDNNSSTKIRSLTKITLEHNWSIVNPNERISHQLERLCEVGRIRSFGINSHCKQHGSRSTYTNFSEFCSSIMRLFMNLSSFELSSEVKFINYTPSNDILKLESIPQNIENFIIKFDPNGVTDISLPEGLTDLKIDYFHVSPLSPDFVKSNTFTNGIFSWITMPSHIELQIEAEIREYLEVGILLVDRIISRKIESFRIWSNRNLFELGFNIQEKNGVIWFKGKRWRKHFLDKVVEKLRDALRTLIQKCEVINSMEYQYRRKVDKIGYKGSRFQKQMFPKNFICINEGKKDDRIMCVRKTEKTDE